LGEWTITFDELSFAEKLIHWDSEFKDAAYKAKRQQIPAIRSAREALERELSAFLDLLEKMEKSDDPLAHLSPAPGNLGKDFPIMMLKSGDWCAYFWVMKDLKNLRGLCVKRGKLDEAALLKILSDAAGRMDD
jgi:hypothetical protein